MSNARNEFIRTSDTLSSHFADFFFEYFILRGIFFQNRGKNILFGEGNGAEFRPQKQQKKNTDRQCHKAVDPVDMYYGRSFINSGKSRGPRTFPQGTP